MANGDDWDEVLSQGTTGAVSGMVMGAGLAAFKGFAEAKANNKNAWTGKTSKDGLDLNTRFVVAPDGTTYDMKPTVERINSGGTYPHKNDGTVFNNREGLLPKTGTYKEYVYPNPTPGAKGVGPMRVVTDGNIKWFTPDHYKLFVPIK